VFAAAFAAQGVDGAVVMPLTMGTSLATIIFTSLSSLRAHHARGTVDWTLFRRMAPGLAIGAICGALVSTQLPCVALKAAFVIFAAVAATQLLLGRRAQTTRQLPGGSALTAAAGGLGVISGLVGVGAATLTVPLLTWCSVSMRTAIGSASALAFPIAVAGTATYVASGLEVVDLPAFSLGYVHLPALAGVVIASMVAAPAGAATSHRLPIGMLRKVFAVGLYAAAGKMLVAAM
jgi:uncharacterized membrane protein YfcA